MISPKLILIGGSPCSGKSYLAEELSKKFSIPWISTDHIWSFMKKIVRKEDFPSLFEDDDITADEYLPTHTAQEVVDLQNRQSADVWKGTLKFIETNSFWRSYIIEGVSVLPSAVKKLMDSRSDICPIFLVDDDPSRLEEIIYRRGLWDDADKYSNEAKKDELPWVLKFDEWLKAEVAKYQLPFINVDTREQVMKEALEIINKQD